MRRGRAPITSGRYAPVIINGQRQWMRDQVALQAEIVALLERGGAMTKKRIIMTLRTAQAAVEAALAALLDAGAIVSYRAKSLRGRMDEHWCVAEAALPQSDRPNGTRYNAAHILAAMQQHAAALHIRGRQ
ncbi:hypothetical protein F3J20_30225 [Paraburkholderia sp. Cy-641]|uniref:hypothetical protein n=1 Tax=Paraburkholderia sp. Cy-641 TaxID=2608337 RepID=UPI00142481A7|nr:hypothetical protein [Paraburkholderia sp. Cy-641]NIF81598.1 hypothetical protein [Paraburkholderia sp. Cy-641]